MADECRRQLKDILQEPLKSGAICVSPDLWSDDHRKISYLGITASFVDKQLQYKVADLCCKPFIADDQSAKNVLIVSIVFYKTMYFLRWLLCKQLEHMFNCFKYIVLTEYSSRKSNSEVSYYSMV